MNRRWTSLVAARRPRGRDAQLAFEALSIEGGLLSPEWLARVAALTAGGQGEANYRIPRGLQLRDEIGRYWRIAQAHWSDFAAGRSNAITAGAARALSERFVLSLLRESFGFASLAATSPAVLAGHTFPIGFCALSGSVPVVIAPAGSGLDALAPAFGEGGRRRSAFGLAQEYLNAAEGASWGLASDGLSLRILRDNASLTRPAWIEADLARIFGEERYADFAALWLLAHETRFGRADRPALEATGCALETWRDAGREEGTRAREQLRGGVEEALAVLGQGFLSHPANSSLRTNLASGALTTTAYFQELLRLVYRLIFLLTVEERGLLHRDSSDEAARRLYAEGYSLRRLRDRSLRRSAHDRYADLWESLKIVFRSLVNGEVRLGLPALGGLFAGDQCPGLDAARLENRFLLLAVFRLCWLREASGLARVNWRDMGPEEMGSVYEGLLELVPQVIDEARSFRFANLADSKGNARKLSGSYYTPDVLVQQLLDGALEPVVDAAVAAHPEAPADAILRLTILDPACGSGHFLLSAARRLAAHVARLSSGGTPTAAEYRRALRQVIAHCIFGVDRNPMALELARMALWLEAMTPDAPLTFIDHHLACGDSLLGLIDFAVLREGIAGAAYDAVVDDSNEVARRLAKKNRDGLNEIAGTRKSGQLGLSFLDVDVARQMKELDVLSDDTLEAVATKRAALQKVLTEAQDPKGHPLALAADLLVAAFLAPKTDETEGLVPTTGDIVAVLRGVPLTGAKIAFARALTRDARVLHWRLRFAQVFANGGFDVVLGNPPWDTLSPDAKEFFSEWDVNVRFQAAEEQQATINALLADPAIARAWSTHCRALYSSVAFMKSSGRYTLFAPGNLGKGDFNVYRMFVETALQTVRPGGRASQIVPEGLYNGANCMAIRKELFERCDLESILGFENHRHVWFPRVDTRAKFALYNALVPGKTDRFRVAFNLRSPAALIAAIQGGTIGVPVAMVREFSPDALAVMEFGKQLDIDIASKMYESHPKFGDESAGPPRRQYMRELDMGTDRELFDEDPSGVPLYEGRMVAQYDHRAKGYRTGRGRRAEWVDLAFSDPAKSIQPQWYVPEASIPAKVQGRYLRYRIGFCDVASPTNERTLVASLIPAGTICGHSVPTFTFDEGSEWSYLVWLAVANSFCMDFLARTKVSLHMALATLDSLPFPRYAPTSAQARFLVPRVAQLGCTGPEMVAFWDQLAGEGWVTPSQDGGVPGALGEEERARLRAEIEAFVAREVFDLSRDQFSYILDTFPIVRKADEKAHGEYRTKRVILETYDAMTEAARTGRPYATDLEPPRAQPRPKHRSKPETPQ